MAVLFTDLFVCICFSSFNYMNGVPFYSVVMQMLLHDLS